MEKKQTLANLQLHPDNQAKIMKPSTWGTRVIKIQS